MRFQDLYNMMITQSRTPTRNLHDIGEEVAGLVLYRLPDDKTRANVFTLRLSDDHKARSPVFHAFDSVVLVSRAFISNKFPSSTLYCAWLETNPSLVIFWERNPTDGVTDNINQERFTRFASLGSAHLVESKHVGHPASSLESVPNKNIGSFPDLSGRFRNLSIISLSETVTDNNCSFNEAEYGALDFMRVIQEFLSNSAEYTTTLLIDDDGDESIDTILTLRSLFEDVCPLGDAMIAARHSKWQNMNKVILNEFKSKWEEAISNVKDRIADIILPDSNEWLEAMWLYVIGCPSDVRSKIGLISSIRCAFSKLKTFDEEEIIRTLKWEGFRPSLAGWIFDRCSSKDFEDDVWKIATFMPWNSYLFTRDNLVHYTHLHYNDMKSEFQSVEFEQVILHVAGVDGLQRRDIFSLPLDMEEKSWTPVDFARAAFNKLKSIIREGFYILGHCCTEQSVVSMSKTGISTLATFQSEYTCGHGMYFFELSWDVFQLDFDVLNQMALQDSPDMDLDSRGLQFRAFVYALTRVFQGAGCDAMSPSLLVFLMPRSAGSFPEPFDAVTKKLPMCNDNSSDLSSWRCACEPLFSLDEDGKPRIDKSQPMNASAICNAISMIQEDDIEKINGFALLGGIVDFRRIQNGVYTSIITDNTPKRILDALKLMKDWDTKQFDLWKNLLQQPSGCFRRPKTMYNHTGGFSQFKPDNCTRPGLEHWNVCPADPIRETVFVQSAALVNLLQAATSIHVIFLDPGNEWTQRLSPQCHLEDTPPKVFSETLALAPSVSSKMPDDRHRYWKNISTCSTLRACCPPLAQGFAHPG